MFLSLGGDFWMCWACGRSFFFENRPTFRFRSTEIEFWKMIFPLVSDPVLPSLERCHGTSSPVAVPCRHGEQKHWRRRGGSKVGHQWEQQMGAVLRSATESGAVFCAFSYEAPRPSFGCLPNFEWGIFLTCQSLSPITA